MNHTRPQTRHGLVPLLGLFVLSAGCSDFLEERPRGSITDVNFFQNGGDALNAVNGAYQSLHSQHYPQNRNYLSLIEFSTPQVVGRGAPNSPWGCWDMFDCEASNIAGQTTWAAMYDAINDANAVVDNVPNVANMDPGLRSRIVAEARFLRSLHYFNLVRLWGGVPLRKSATNSLKDLEAPRAPANEVYDFIIQDLAEAQKSLPLAYPASEFGRATRGAAQTLLAKVYLQRAIAGKTNPFGDALYWPTVQPGDLDNAIAELRKVIQSNQYRLVDSYGDLWREETEQNSEVIFSVQNINYRGLGAHSPVWFAPRQSGFAQQGPWNDANAELPFYQSYAPGDKRKPVTWLTEFVDPRGNLRKFDENNILGDTYPNEGPSLDKYIAHRRDVGDVHASPKDLVLLRYADVLLMLAEALHEKSPGSAEALALVNQVRARAGVAPLAQVTREALYWERNWELATEQHARYDAPRFWDVFKEHVRRNSLVRKANPKRYPLRTAPWLEVVFDEPQDRLVAIPQEAIDRNPKLVQNPGY